MAQPFTAAFKFGLRTTGRVWPVVAGAGLVRQSRGTLQFLQGFDGIVFPVCREVEYPAGF